MLIGRLCGGLISVCVGKRRLVLWVFSGLTGRLEATRLLVITPYWGLLGVRPLTWLQGAGRRSQTDAQARKARRDLRHPLLRVLPRGPARAALALGLASGPLPSTFSPMLCVGHSSLLLVARVVSASWRRYPSTQPGCITARSLTIHSSRTCFVPQTWQEELAMFAPLRMSA
jgi:hypothetical protein